jgi:hypothetical protein
MFQLPGLAIGLLLTPIPTVHALVRVSILLGGYGVPCIIKV